MAFLGKKVCPLGNNQVFEITVCIEEEGGGKGFEETMKTILSFQHLTSSRIFSTIRQKNPHVVISVITAICNI